jgi:hypothetical protein
MAGLQNTFMPAGDASLTTAQVNQKTIDSDHGIYRDQKERTPGDSSRGSPRLVLRGLVAQLSHLPKSETQNGTDVTPPGDAEPRSSVDDDDAEKWAANR